MIRGYLCRPSEQGEEDPERNALIHAGCGTLYIEERVYARDGQKSRPALRRLLREMEPGDVVLVWRLECLAMSVDRLIRTVVRILDRGTALRSLSEPWADTTGESAALLKTCFSWLYGFSEEIRQSRYAMARKAKEEKRGSFGRPYALSEQDQQEIMEWMAAGLPMSEIARRKNVHVHTIYRWRDAAEKQGLALPMRTRRTKRSGGLIPGENTTNRPS